MRRNPLSPAPVAFALFLAGCAGGNAPNPAASPDEVGTIPQPGPYGTPPEAAGPVGGAPAGVTSEPDVFESRVYEGLKFRYRVYVPAQYQPGTPAALMVFQDGSGTYLGVLKTAQVFDNLIHDGSMPITIGLFIDPGTPSGVYHSNTEQELRAREYDTLDDTYVHFLTEEIIPDVILGSYTITTDPDGWGIGGQSSGGIAAFTAAWQRPDRFHRVITANGSFVDIHGGNAYPDIIAAAPRKPLRVYLLSGTQDLDNRFGNWLEANTAMAAALDAKGYEYRFRTGSGGHYPPLQALADYPDALRWLWRGWSPK